MNAELWRTLSALHTIFHLEISQSFIKLFKKEVLLFPCTSLSPKDISSGFIRWLNGSTKEVRFNSGGDISLMNRRAFVMLVLKWSPCQRTYVLWGPPNKLEKKKKRQEIDHRNCVWYIWEWKSKFSFHGTLSCRKVKVPQVDQQLNYINQKLHLYKQSKGKNWFRNYLGNLSWKILLHVPLRHEIRILFICKRLNT